jgi:hypothetical protein
MSILLAETINLLNEKGIKYKAEVKENVMSMKFGVVSLDAEKKAVSSIITLIPQEKAVSVGVTGKEKSLDIKGLTAYVDTVVKLRALQEEEAKLYAELTA